MPVDSNLDLNSGEMERTPLATLETLRVRCPHCRKLYMVQFNDIQEAKPRFECVQCHTRFWLSIPDMELSGEVQGIPLQVKEIPPKARPHNPAALKKDPCPKCFKPVESGRSECPSCGVMIEKYRASMTFVEGIPPHSATLAALWKRVVSEYAQESLHSEFLRACQRERNLPYAGAQYAAMARLMPTDEITGKRLKEVQALAAVMVPMGTAALRVPRFYPRLWQVPLMGATIVVIVGMVAPTFRNLVGLGAVLFFLAVALRFHFRRGRG